jgi:hypothetical protein
MDDSFRSIHARPCVIVHRRPGRQAHVSELRKGWKVDGSASIMMITMLDRRAGGCHTVCPALQSFPQCFPSLQHREKIQLFRKRSREGTVPVQDPQPVFLLSASCTLLCEHESAGSGAFIPRWACFDGYAKVPSKPRKTSARRRRLT